MMRRKASGSYGSLISIVMSAVLLGGLGAGADDEGEGSMRIIDFAHGAPVWRSIDDVVMGGASSSVMSIENGVAVFRGIVSLENNGGFASGRSPSGDFDLSPFDGIAVRLRGDGKRYAIRLRTAATFDGVSYQVKLQPAAGQWQDFFLPFSQFEPVFRGRKLENHPPLEPAKVTAFGLLIADRQEGPFRLELAWIEGAFLRDQGRETVQPEPNNIGD